MDKKTRMTASEIYLMDCMEGMKNYPDNYFDLAIVDPPYGINQTLMNMGSRKTIKPDKTKTWDSAIPNEHYFNELFRVSNNQIIWGSNYFPLPNSQYFVVWDKGETMYGRDFAEAELAWVRKGGTRIFKKSPNQLDRIHPTQKPVDLYEWLLKNYAKEGDKILDTHGGSMSSVIACLKRGFNITCYEIHKEYFEKGKQRIENYLSQGNLFMEQPEVKFFQ